MKHIFILFVLFAAASTAAVQQTPLNPHLAAEIDSLKEADQAPGLLANAADAEAAFKAVIRSNFPRVKAIAETYGFPGYDLVGKASSDNYWILVQHSDFDLSFQKKMLELMKRQVEKNNASGNKYAYLLDRIDCNEGRPQRYGTQIRMTDSGYQPRPLADVQRVDVFRKSMGLSTLAEYLDVSNAAFNELNKGRAQIVNKKLVHLQ